VLLVVLSLVGQTVTHPGLHGAVTGQHVIAATTPNRPVQSKTIYLNRHAENVSPSDIDDSTTLMSTIVSAPVVAPGWDVDDETWNQTVACVQRTWAPFDVAIVTDLPPAGQHYIEALIGGYPSAIGVDTHFSGVSPMREDCGVIEDSLVFVFPEKLDDDPTETCAIISQEVAHSFGLDHEMLAPDPMSYLAYDHERSFQDQLVSCGEYEARTCGPDPTAACSEKQSSVQLLAQRVGFTGGYRLGTVTITEPVDQSTVGSTFEIQASETSTFVFASGAHLFVDSQPVDYIAGIGPYTFSSPNLGNGTHEIAVIVDQGDNHVETSIDVTVDEDAHDADALGCNSGGGARLAIGAIALAFVLCRRRCSRANNAATSARSRTR